MIVDRIKPPKGVFGFQALPTKRLKEEMNKISHLDDLEKTKATQEITKKIQLYSHVQDNLIVNQSHLILSHLMAQTPSTALGAISAPNNFKITKIAFGTGNPAPSPLDTGLDTLVEKSPGVDFYTVGTPSFQEGASPADMDAIITFSTLMDGADGNGVNYQESGLFCEAEFMFARTTFPLITKTAEIAFSFNWTIIFP